MRFYDNELDRVQGLTTFALDCETDSKDARKATLNCIVIATDDFAVRISADRVHEVYPLIKRAKLLILQNFKYDYTVLKRHGFDIDNVPFRDTMLMHHLIDENEEHGLDYMVQKYFNDNYKQLFWETYENFSDAPYLPALDYVCRDGIYTFRLYRQFLSVLSGKRPLVEHVHALAFALYQTEYNGVRVDTPAILEYAPKAQEHILKAKAALRPPVETECTAWEMQKWLEEISKRKTDKGKAGVKRPEFNFASSSQKQWLMYDALKFPVVKKTKAGLPATDYDALELLKRERGVDHPFLDRLIEYSGLETLYNTFVVGLLERAEDGRIYPDFNVNGTLTGRISSSNPNLQNMPKEGVYRGFFIPSPGMCFFGADYSQLEVVVEANLSGDEQLKRIILEGASKHDITNEELKIGDRNKAKTVNFCMQYHGTHFKIAKLLKISEGDALHVWNRYWEVYKGVKALKDYTDSLVDRGEPIVSPFGRTRRLPSTFESKAAEGRAKRQAYNALIQGTGADCTHTAFRIRAASIYPGRLLWPIHDEILGECHPENVEEEKRRLVATMCDVGVSLGFKLPLSAVAYGPLERWQKT